MTRRRTIAAAGAAALALAASFPAAAGAHAIQGKRDLPIPEWLFGWGAALVLLVSFLALAVLWPKPRLEDEEWRPLRLGRALGGRVAEVLCGAIGTAVFALTVYSAIAGEDSITDNFAPTFVYVVFWVGMVPVSVLFGDVFRAFNPWRAIARAVGRVTNLVTRGDSSEPFEYPHRLGRWPAAAGLVGFTTMELAIRSGSTPRTLAIGILLYSGVTWFGMALYGIERWCDRGEAFSVYYGLFGRLSVFERRDGVVGRRRFLSGLTGIERARGTVPLLAVMIGSTSFDGFSQSNAWSSTFDPKLIDLWKALGFSATGAEQAAKLTGLLVVIALVYGFYRLGIAGARTVGGNLDAGRLAGAFVHSLVPIALAYVLAHYVSLLLFQGQALPALLSDPLGHGSDLLGWADNTIDYGFLSGRTIWYLQVVFVVTGHVLALMLAHDRALVVYDRAAQAVRSQYWMLGVMVGFTSLALWLLSEAARA